MRKLGRVIPVGLAMAFFMAGCGNRPSSDASLPGAPTPMETETASAPQHQTAETPSENDSVGAIPLVVPGRGTLKVPVPEGARAKPVESEVPGAVALRIDNPEPDPSVITLTVLGVPGMMPGFGSNAWLSEELDRWKTGLPEPEMAADAVPVDFHLENVSGVYVTLEDPSAEAGHYPHLVQGFFNVDGCIVSFQALHHETRASAANRLLALLVEADWEPEANPASAPKA